MARTFLEGNGTEPQQLDPTVHCISTYSPRKFSKNIGGIYCQRFLLPSSSELVLDISAATF